MSECKYTKEVYEYETGADEVCGLYWKMKGQEGKPDYERDTLYCHYPRNCTLAMLYGLPDGFDGFVIEGKDGDK